MLRWICGINFEVEDVPEEFQGDFIILVCLVQGGIIKTIEADAVLQTIVDTRSGNVSKDIKYPNKVSTRALNVSSIFTRVYAVFYSCINAVGIKHLEVCRISISQLFSMNVHFSE
jgi:hypothetical protein